MGEGKTLIIAEAGVNHNGDVEIAKKMIDSAKSFGADIIKFQTGLPHNVISKYAPKATYQKNNTGDANESQLEMARKFSFKYDVYEILKSYCEKVGIEFLSTPFDEESIEYLHGIGLNKWKIPSGEITNLPYLEHIGSFGEQVILSTGMSTLTEVESALNVLQKAGSSDITLLHCTTDYPTSYEDVNLNAMLLLQKTFNVKVGYSDHTLGIDIPIAAVAMGAKVIEKHFTLSRTMCGPDHVASLEPGEFKKMVVAIRNVEKAFGDGEKKPREVEIPNIAIARKSIVAKRAIKKGEKFSISNITVKRPGTGISPMKWHDLIGQYAKRDFDEDEFIEL